MTMEDLKGRLILQRWVSSQQYYQGEVESQRTGKSIYASLIKLGFMKEEEVFRFLSVNTGIPCVNLSQYKISPSVLALVSEEFCRTNFCLPLFKIARTLYVAMVDPLNVGIIVNLANLTGLEIQPVFAPISSLQEAIDFYFGPEDVFLHLQQGTVSPQKLKRFTFYRQAKRFPLEFSFQLGIGDKEVVNLACDSLSVTTSDITSTGEAIGVKVPLFLPPQLKVILHNPILSKEVKGEVIWCQLERSRDYLAGIKFIEIEKSVVEVLLRRAKKT